MKIIYLLLTFVLIYLSCPLLAQEREPDSTPSSLANLQLKAKLKQQVTSNIKIFYFGKKSQTFIVDKRNNVTITQQCGDKLENSTCLAAMNLKEVNMKDITSEEKRDAKHAGPALCQKSLNAEVISGKDRDGNITTFCAFKDGTMVSSDTLIHWGNKNAKERKH